MKITGIFSLLKLVFTLSSLRTVKALVTQLCLILCDPWSADCQAPLSMGFSRQEYWSGWLFPSPGDLPFSRGSSRPRDQAQVSHTAGGFFTV